MKSFVVLVAGLAVIAATMALPASERVKRQSIEEAMGLPSNASAIRPNIVNTFSCENRIYGYYADVDNDCQIFHVCLPVTLPDGNAQTFKWSFICPEETIFNQESFTCTYPTDAVPCSEAPNLYNLNQEFGKTTPPPVARR